jgi:hypothetical protein
MTRTRLTPEQRRERNRLRSERWRRAHGIGPRRPAERPWLALGLSPEACESPRAGRADSSNHCKSGGARPARLADCGTRREPRQDCDCERSYGGAINQLSQRFGGMKKLGDNNLIPISNEQATLVRALVEAARASGAYGADILGWLISDRVRVKRAERMAILIENAKAPGRSRHQRPRAA